jgi:hypothetical protein
VSEVLCGLLLLLLRCYAIAIAIVVVEYRVAASLQEGKKKSGRGGFDLLPCLSLLLSLMSYVVRIGRASSFWIVVTTMASQIAQSLNVSNFQVRKRRRTKERRGANKYVT